MFELSWNAFLVNMVTAFALGFGWAWGVWVAGRIQVWLSRPPMVK